VTFYYSAFNTELNFDFINFEEGVRVERIVRRQASSPVRSSDGKGDVLILDPDQYSWQRYYSQPDGSFAAQPLVHLGDPGAQPL
jgi:hypothetical protein